MTAMSVYADDVTIGDVLDSGAVVIAADIWPDDFVGHVVNVTVLDGEAVEVIGFAYDDLLPILRAVDC